MIEPNITSSYLNKIKVFANDIKMVFLGDFHIYGKAQKDTQRMI
jgi:hypothetical protein